MERADEVLLGDLDAVEVDLVGAEDVAGQRVDPAQLDPGAGGVEQQHRQPLVLRCVAVGADVADDLRAGEAGAGAPHLLAVEHEPVALVLGEGPHGGGVGARVGLGDGDRQPGAAGHHRRQQVAAHRGGAELLQHEAGLEREAEALGDVEAGPAELLGDDGQLGGATPGAAVLVGEPQLDPPELGEAPEQLGRVVVGLVPRLGLLRRADVVDEPAGGVPQQLLLLGQPEIP